LSAEPRKPGRLKGRIRVGPDFDEPLPDEILSVFRDPAFGAYGVRDPFDLTRWRA
jgi:hypothetical protein